MSYFTSVSGSRLNDENGFGLDADGEYPDQPKNDDNEIGEPVVEHLSFTSNLQRFAEERLAEELVVNKLSAKLGLRFSREVELKGSSGIRFDAIAESGSGPVIVEVKYLTSARNARRVVDRELQRIASLFYKISKSELEGARVIFAMVFNSTESEQNIAGLKHRLEEYVKKVGFPLSVEIEVFSLETLKEGVSV